MPVVVILNLSVSEPASAMVFQNLLSLLNCHLYNTGKELSETVAVIGTKSPLQAYFIAD